MGALCRAGWCLEVGRAHPAPAAGEPAEIIGEGALLAMVGGKLSTAQALDAGLLQLPTGLRQAQRWQAAFGAP